MPTSGELQSALGYEFSEPNVLARASQAAAASRPGAWLGSKILQPLDSLVLKATKGRTTASEVLAGLPVVTVTTTGRKSGQRRPAPLIAVPIDGDLALLGTNFGQEATPAWVHNLEAEPSATVAFRDVEIDVVARPATDDEYQRVFAESGRLYSGYGKYRSRVGGRAIRVFVLERA